MQNETILSLKKIQKYIGTREIFSDVNFNVHANDRISLVGQNGKGKTTLLKIILGLEEEDSGDIERVKGLKIGYLPQHGNFESLQNTLEAEIRAADRTVATVLKEKNIIEEKLETVEGDELETVLADYEKIMDKYEGIDGYTYEIRTEKALRDFGFKNHNFNLKVENLSGGEKTRLGLAKLKLQNPDLLILDEPTNHLDLETIIWLEKYLSEWKGAIILVSHDRYFLDNVCDKTFEIYEGRIRQFNTNYSDYLIERERITEAEIQAYKKQSDYIAKQEKFIEKFRSKATKASAVQSRIKMLDRMEKVEVSNEKNHTMKINYNIKNVLPVKVMEMKEITVFRDDKLLMEIPGKIEIYNNDKIGIIGKNGTGKTSLIKDIMDLAEDGKKAKINGKIRLGYYAQSHENLNEKQSILENMKSVCDLSSEKIRSMLGGLLFTGDDVYKKVSDLSGGEKARIAIAKLVLGEANFLILDEPTNHLDIESRNVIVQFLKNFNGPIMMISHDRYTLNEICNQIWEIKYQKINRVLGNYDRYIEIMTLR